MIPAFKSFIRQKKLFSPSDKILIAVSGGLDSIVMAHLFKQSGFEFCIAHCNFKLRSEESDGDEKFVRALAAHYSVPVFVETFQTKEHATQKGVSTQMAARELRYAFFERTCAENGFKYIATAHHADDFAETLILNLVRGSGMAALHGIKAKKKNVIRPLLFALRQDIVAYAQENGLEWREDSSNATDDYSRNRIRHHIIPLLKELNPSLTETFLTNGYYVNEVEEVLKEFVSTQRKEIVTEDGDTLVFDSTKLLQLPAPVTFLFEILSSYEFNSSMCKEIFLALSGTEEKTFFAKGWHAVKERKRLIVKKNTSLTTDSLVLLETGSFLIGNITLSVEKVNNTATIKQNLEQGNYKEMDCVYFDADKISFPLTFRHWQNGDVFSPMGMQGKKLVSDYFTDEKLSAQQKQTQFLLLANNTVIWVVGKRLSEQAKINSHTKNILQVKISFHE